MRWMFVFLFFTFVSCENDLATVQGSGKSKTQMDEVKDVESYFSQSGLLKAKLTAPLMLRYHDTMPRVEFPHTLHVDFFETNENIQSYLDAQKGFYYESQGKVLLEDRVIVIRKDGDTLKTQKLYWEQGAHRFFTDADVEIRQKTKTIFGTGFESDEQLKNFRIDTVTGVMLVADEEVSNKSN